jgi:hypothetical protein
MPYRLDNEYHDLSAYPQTKGKLGAQGVYELLETGLFAGGGILLDNTFAGGGVQLFNQGEHGILGLGSVFLLNVGYDFLGARPE